MKTRKITKQQVGSVVGWLTEKEFRDGKYVIMVASYMQDMKSVTKTHTTGIKVGEYKNGKKKLVEKMLTEYLTAKNTELTEQSKVVPLAHFDPKCASVFSFLDYYMEVRKLRLDGGSAPLGKTHYERGLGFIASLRKFFLERLQRRDMPLLDFRREHLIAYFDSLYTINARGVMNTASTVRHYTDFFLPAFRYAYDNFLIPIEITRGIKKPTIAPKEMPYLTRGEIITFFGATADTACPVCRAVQVLLLTGARRSELLALRFEDIDRTNRLIHLRRKVLTEQGGELKFYDKMKTAQSNRTLPLTNVVEMIIDKMELEDKTDYSEYDGFIFRHASGKLIRPDELTKGIKDVCRAANISPINLHGTRHSFANLCRQSEVAEEVRSALLGHSTKSITGRYSNHIEPYEKVNAMNKIIATLELTV